MWTLILKKQEWDNWPKGTKVKQCKNAQSIKANAVGELVRERFWSNLNTVNVWYSINQSNQLVCSEAVMASLHQLDHGSAASTIRHLDTRSRILDSIFIYMNPKSVQMSQDW
jgi:hypothetical protein